jgi:hypothetical protein
MCRWTCELWAAADGGRSPSSNCAVRQAPCQTNQRVRVIGADTLSTAACRGGEVKYGSISRLYQQLPTVTAGWDTRMQSASNGGDAPLLSRLPLW